MSSSEAFSYTHTYILHTLHSIHAACVFSIFSHPTIATPNISFISCHPLATRLMILFFYSFWKSTVVVHNLAHKPNSSTFSYMLCPFRFHSVSIQISHFLLFDNRNVAMHHHWCACMLVIQMPFLVSFLSPINLLHFDLPWDTEWLWRISKSVPYWALIAYVAMHENIKGEQWNKLAIQPTNHSLWG